MRAAAAAAAVTPPAGAGRRIGLTRDARKTRRAPSGQRYPWRRRPSAGRSDGSFAGRRGPTCAACCSLSPAGARASLASRSCAAAGRWVPPPKHKEDPTPIWAGALGWCLLLAWLAPTRPCHPARLRPRGGSHLGWEPSGGSPTARFGAVRPNAQLPPIVEFDAKNPSWLVGRPPERTENIVKSK